MTNAAQFNATGERLTRATGPSPNAAYTIAFWVRIDTNRSADYQILFTYLMNASEWESIMLDASNRLAIEAGVGGTGYRSAAGTAFGTGTWRHVALVRSSTTSLKAYVNGTETLSLTTNVGTRSAAVSEFTFGSDQYDEDSRSSIAYARAWTAVLSTSELAAEKDAASAVRTADLWGDWSMQSNGNDATANARHLSAVGTISYVTDGPVLPLIVAPSAASSAATATSPTVTGGGGVTISPAAASVAATATDPSVTAGSAVTVAPAAATSTATAISPTVVAGAITLTPSVAAAGTSASLVLLAGACTGGVLEVDSTNPRYFRDRAGIVVMAGFHTWETLVDHGDSDPPDEFDYPAFLDALTAKGCNFIKLWACESLRDWCDAVKYFYPYVYNRPGPGNANDGKAKADLTSFNAAYFARLRERAIEAGNRGIYVCVQLFQGWQVTQKGYSTGAPGTYHPFNAANNINSIDGDTDNDGQVGETRDITWTAVYDLQKAYVREVINAVNDLDHVIYEISNEEDEVDNASGQTKVAWQHDLIDYIHTYEAGLPKQHPVGMTVQWPSGSDTDLFSSNAEWISPKDLASVGSVTASNGDKVILWDTDHVIGLTDEHEWIWMAVARGCNPLYMDEWDGDFYGTDKRLTAANIKIRDNLGYALDYAARLDLATTTPQGSLSSTGYALAKTTGLAKILAYQPSSGAFTVDLAGITGTWAVEWLRTSTGATQAGSDIAGGAVRTLTPPWAGEDVVALLERTADSLTPAVAGAAATAASPTVVIGGITVSPEAGTAAATAIAPTVILGAIVLAPETSGLAATAAAPVVILGALVIAPDAGQAAAAAAAPIVVYGATTATPDAAAAAMAAADPTAILGAISISPAAAQVAATATDPAIEAGGAISISPAAAASTTAATSPTVELGATTAAPEPATAAATAISPTVQEGGISVAPDAATMATTATEPSVIYGALVIVADAAASSAASIAPTVELGATTATPTAASVAATAAAPTVIIGVIVAAVTLTARRNFTLSARRSFTLHYRR